MSYIGRIKERWESIKALIVSDEYYLCTAKEETNSDNYFNPISYKYMTNSERKIFFMLINDDISNKMIKSE